MSDSPAARGARTPERRAGWRSPGSTAAGRRSRERILQASIDVITEVGIDRVRLAEIARRAGMSSGQVMYYFTSKEHILLETLAWQEHQETAQRRLALPGVPGRMAPARTVRGALPAFRAQRPGLDLVDGGMGSRLAQR